MWKKGNAETGNQGKQPQRSVKLFTNERFRFSSPSQSLMQFSSYSPPWVHPLEIRQMNPNTISRKRDLLLGEKLKIMKLRPAGTLSGE